MIFIDPKLHNISNISKSKKQFNKKQKFQANISKPNNKIVQSSINVNSIDNAIFLQEFDQSTEDSQNFTKITKKALESLKKLQINLLEGNFNKNDLVKVKEIISKNKHKFIDQKSFNIINNIEIRIEVEIAKIIYNR